MKASTAITRNSLRQAWAPWAARWERQARRIDALSLRERAILFLCIAAVLAAAFDSLVLTPLSTRARQRAEALASQAAEVKQLREQFIVASQAGRADPSTERMARLQAAQAERNRLDAALNQDTGGRGTDLPSVLQRLLLRQPGLMLSRLHLLDDATPRAGESGIGGLAGLHWQGVELQIEGGYQPTLSYLRSLEQQLPGLRWGDLRLRAAAEPSASQWQARLYVLRAAP